jgi:ribulose-5-phosphate 4-epimerase/fuculose-1-phosphate aldolase
MTAVRAPAANISDAEWKVRVDLAALYRILDHLDMTYLIYTHLSARVPGEENTFLINRFGEMFGEVTASSLIKMDFDGNVIGEGNFSRAGFAIHSAVYMARPDINCVLHTHSIAGSAVSTLKHGLLPISQDALEIYDEIGYHEYDVPGTKEECEALGRSCAIANSIILRNHGLMTIGPTIPSAFIRMYYLERACEIQVAAGRSDDTLIMAEKPTEVLAKKLQALRASGRYGELEWESLQRLLKKKGSDHAR